MRLNVTHYVMLVAAGALLALAWHSRPQRSLSDLAGHGTDYALEQLGMK